MASFSITVPDDQVDRVADAFGVPVAQVPDMIRRLLRDHVVQREMNEWRNQQKIARETQFKTDAEEELAIRRSSLDIT
jgi:hypothetical protein